MKSCLIAVAFVLTPVCACAQWHAAAGPLGGNVNVVAIDPCDADRVYAGGTLLWQSSDGGKTWQRIEGLPDTRNQNPVMSIAISRDKDGPIFLGLVPLIASHDRGKTWESRQPIKNLGWGTLQAGPAGTRVFYAAGGNSVLRSDDNGETWRPLSGWPKEANSVENFIADRFDAGTLSFIYRAGPQPVFSLSRDAGKTFTTISLPKREGFAASLSTDPDDKGTLYLCALKEAWSRSNEKRYYYSYDNGATWELFWDPASGEADPAMRRKIQRVFPDMIPSPLPVWGGWPLSRRELTWSEDKPGRVVAVFAGELFRSDDYGRNWEPAMGGLVASSVERIMLDPQDAQAAYCADSRNLWRTADRGKTWTRINAIEQSLIEGLMFSPDGEHVLVLSYGLWRGTRDGQQWEKVWEPDRYENRPVALFSFDAAGEAGAAEHVCVAVGNGFCLESKDDGKTWSRAGDNDLDLRRAQWSKNFAQRRVRDLDVWYLQDLYNPLLVSTDHGRAWTPHKIEGATHYPAWAVSRDGSAWIAADGRLRILPPLTEPPAPAPGEGLAGVAAIACDPADDKTAYVACRDGRILRTTDSAVSFIVLEGGPSGVPIASLAVSPHDGALWVGTSGNGVWILDNPKSAEAKPVEQ
jgi:photosystem II stability/assembly factor-like uncharacterized protein